MKNKNHQTLIEKRNELKNCACFNLRKAARVVTQIYDAKLRHFGLRPTQLTILFATWSVDSTTITRLSEMLVLERTSLTRNLKPLEKQGLIKIEQGNDSRTRIVKLTDKGYNILETALPLWEEAQSYVIKQLGENSFNDLLGLLSSAIKLSAK